MNDKGSNNKSNYTNVINDNNNNDSISNYYYDDENGGGDGGVFTQNEDRTILDVRSQTSVSSVSIDYKTFNSNNNNNNIINVNNSSKENTSDLLTDSKSLSIFIHLPAPQQISDTNNLSSREHQLQTATTTARVEAVPITKDITTNNTNRIIDDELRASAAIAAAVAASDFKLSKEKSFNLDPSSSSNQIDNNNKNTRPQSNSNNVASNENPTIINLNDQTMNNNDLKKMNNTYNNNSLMGRYLNHRKKELSNNNNNNNSNNAQHHINFNNSKFDLMTNDSLLSRKTFISEDETRSINRKYNTSCLNLSKPNDYGQNSPLSYFSGQPITKGYYLNKVNPVVSNEYAYLNRNKIVNRRLAIKRQIENSCGLQSIGKLPDEFYSSSSTKTTTSNFALQNPSTLPINEFRSCDNLSNEKMLADLNNVDAANNAITTTTTCKTPINNSRSSNSNLKSFKNKKFIKSSNLFVIEKNEPLSSSLAANDYKLEGPNPFSYHVPRCPPNQKAAPIISIGKRSFNEKDGGGRTSWQKEWFYSNEPYLVKTDFKREVIWPSPVNYKLKSSFIRTDHTSNHNLVKNRFGLHSSASNKQQATQSMSSLGNLASNQQESNNSQEDYTNKSSQPTLSNLINTFKLIREPTKLEIVQSVNYVAPSAPKISIKFREKGTELWPKQEITPGPGSYDHHKFRNVSRSNPKFSLAHAKNQVSSNYNLGPFAAVI